MYKAFFEFCIFATTPFLSTYLPKTPKQTFLATSKKIYQHSKYSPTKLRKSNALITCTTLGMTSIPISHLRHKKQQHEKTFVCQSFFRCLKTNKGQVFICKHVQDFNKHLILRMRIAGRLQPCINKVHITFLLKSA